MAIFIFYGLVGGGVHAKRTYHTRFIILWTFGDVKNKRIRKSKIHWTLDVSYFISQPFSFVVVTYLIEWFCLYVFGYLCWLFFFFGIVLSKGQLNAFSVLYFYFGPNKCSSFVPDQWHWPMRRYIHNILYYRASSASFAVLFILQNATLIPNNISKTFCLLFYHQYIVHILYIQMVWCASTA